MQIWLTLIGGIFGLMIGFAIHTLFRSLRTRHPSIAASCGWLVSTVIAYDVIVLTGECLNDPHAPMFPSFLAIAVLLSLLLLLCGSIGVLHRRYFHDPWWKMFGVIMSEVAVAGLTIFVLHQFMYSIADILRGGSREVEDILRSFAHARYLLSCLDVVLGITLLLTELLNHKPLQK